MRPHTQKNILSLAVASACASWMAGASAQQTEAKPESQQLETVVVTGVRASLAKSLDLKRAAVGTRDSIVAEDIGKFPEQNIADALQRLPGIEVLKDPATNEGQRIQMRGLPAEYTVTLFNGAPVRATSGGNIGSATRDFNYDIFPSELFSRVDVYKTPEAFLEEGGAAGVVDMRTPRPFDFSGRKITYSVATTKNKSNNSNSPRGQLLFSDTWGNFGMLAQVSLTKASQGNAGAVATGHFSDSRDGTSLPAPANITFPGATAATGIGRQFSYDLYTNSPLANLGNLTAAQVKSGFLPRLMRTISNQAERERQGGNLSLQYKDARWNISLDSVLARLQTENKNNTASFNVRDSTCGRFITPAGQPAPVAPNRICGDALTPNATTGSVNNALIPIKVALDDNNNLSGTFGNFQYGTVSAWQLSRTKFDYHALNAEYKATEALTLNAQLSHNKSVAWRSQTTLTADNGFADGVGPSQTGTTGFTVTPGAINRHTVTFDLSDPVTPTISSNRNLLDPKLHTTFGNSGGGYVVESDKQKIAKLNAAYEYENQASTLHGSLKGGVSRVESTKAVDQRGVPNLLNGLTLPSGKLFSAATLAERAAFMQGLMTPNDTANVAKAAGGSYPVDFLVFDLDTIKNKLNALELNRNAPQNAPASFNTVEKVTAVFLQNDLEFDVFGRPLRTNVGVRHVKTEVDIQNNAITGSTGSTPIFSPASLSTGYSHTLPSVSLAYDLLKDVVLRASAGKTIKRSSVSAISKTYGVRSAGDGYVDAGNPNLVPEESSSRDWGAEWYFAKGGVLALAGYDKSFTGRLATTQTVVPFSQVGLPCPLFTPNICAPAGGGGPIDLRIFTPVNQDSFKIKGLELAYQQSFSFLPSPFNGLGVYGSYTKNKTLGADRTYVSRAADGTAVVSPGPSVPLVPEDTYSISTYYEQGPLFLRLSYNHKSEWAGTDTLPNVYGFQRFSNARGYLDASFGWKFSKALEVRLDGTNLTNQRIFDFYRQFEGKFGDEKSRVDNAIQVGRGYAISLRGTF